MLFRYGERCFLREFSPQTALVTFGGSMANLLHFSWQHDLLVMTEKMKNSLQIGGSFCTHRVI